MRGCIGLSRECVNDFHPVRMEPFDIFKFGPKDDVVPLSIGIDQGVADIGMQLQSTFNDSEVRNASGARADMNQMICLRQDSGAERIRTRESGNDQARPAWRPMHKQRRQQGGYFVVPET